MRDELDRKHRRFFAWKIVKPGENVDFPETEAETLAPPASASIRAAPDSAEVEIPVNADVDIDEALEKSRPECAAIEREVGEAWLMQGEPQVRATRAILRRVAKVGVALIGLGKLASLRLARLVTRHYRRLSSVQRSDCGYIFGLDLSHAESLELVVEAAHGHGDIVHLMSAGDDRSERPSWASPACSARLAQVVEESPKARLHALDLISHCALADARPVLRAALRRPEWPVRACAGRLLWTLRELTPDDCLFLLQEAAKPRRRMTAAVRDAFESCSDTLREALPTLAPPGGDAELLAILGDPVMADSPWLGGPWALQLLASTYPAKALAPIDRQMRRETGGDRLLAVTAIGNLPDADARPRLVQAAADPAACVGDWARTTYHRRFHERCPENPAGGLATELLAAAPSARLLSRMSVLRLVSIPTRAVWAATLLSEAPDREALAGLVFLLGADGVRFLASPGLPEGAVAWGQTLVERFGVVAGVEAIVSLAKRYGYSRGSGWVDALAALVEKAALAPELEARIFAFVRCEPPASAEQEVLLRYVTDALEKRSRP